MYLRLVLFFCSILFCTLAYCCDLNLAEPIASEVGSLHDSTEPRQILISNSRQSTDPNAPGVLQIHSADSFTLLSQLNIWPTPLRHIPSITADPLVVDADYDGLADGVYSIDISGQLWFIPLVGHDFTPPQLVADFSLTQAIFDQPLQLVQTLSPDEHGVLRRQTILFAIGRKADGDMLFALKHLRNNSTPVIASELIDRTTLAADEVRYGITEQLWTQLSHSSGWFIRLTQHLTTVPQVYAGVVYFTAASSEALQPDCSLANDTQPELYAVHLHHAGLVYSQRNWVVPGLSNGRLTLATNTQGELELSLQIGEQTQPLMDNLLAISEECADCVVPLDAGQYPKRIRLATFQTEQGAH